MEFDYVIIGSGAVGSTIAFQLSKNSALSIAIVDIAKSTKPKIKRKYKAPFINNCSRSYTHSISNVFGGNTELWASKIYLMTKGEIECWPIKYDELLEYPISLANDLIKKYCDSKENLFYISTRDYFITKNGLPSEEFFIKDKLHLNKKGYKLWAEIIKNSLKPIVSHN